MPKLLRIFLPLVLAALVVVAVSSASPTATNQNIGGWARPHMDGDAAGLNSLGFIPAPRSANMVWVNDVIGGPNWINGIFGANGDASDYAFTEINGVHYAVEAEYNNFRLIDLTDQSISCYDSALAETAACGVIADNVPCVGSQGDVVVHGNILVRAHEGDHNIPNGDLSKACLLAGNEVQRIDLTGMDTDGDSFTLQYNGQTTIPIVRGANYTAAGIANTLAGGNEQQQVVITGNDNNGDRYSLNYNGNETVPFVRGTNQTTAAVTAALQGVAEVQTATLTSFDADGDSYRFTYNGQNSQIITRGQNNTTAGIQAAIQGGNEQQLVTFTTAFNPATQNFRFRINGNNTPLFGLNGLALNNANIADAINGIAGFAGTVTAATTGNPVTSFTLTYAGASAGVNVANIEIFGCTCTTTVRENVRGATAMTGWPTGATVAVGTISDTTVPLTFGGSLQGTNVTPFTVTNGTGGVTGVVAETTPGSAGILPAGTTATGITVADTGFTVTLGGVLANMDALPLTVTNQNDTGGVAVLSASVREAAKGSTGIAGWTVGGTATAAQVTDAGFQVTFAGTLAATDVTALSVTNGTGGVTGTMQERIKGAPGVSWGGVTIHDISDPHNVKFIAAVAMCGNAHTITKYFDDVRNELLILGTSANNATMPQFGLPTCPTYQDPNGPPGFDGFEEIVHIPLDHPEKAKLHMERRIGVGGTGNCHDVNVFEELHLMATACSGAGNAQLIDMTDTLNTHPLWPEGGFTWPGLVTVHSAAFSWSGKYVYINGEPGGGSSNNCSFEDDTVKPIIHILDRVTGNLVGQWALPRPQLETTNPANQENCTTHTISLVPSLDRDLIAWSGYQAGISVIDVTNPKAPREIAFMDQQTYPGNSGAGCWTGYWYNDNLFCNELLWGQHVFTVNEPWWKQAMTFGELNPQTNTKLIRCQVSFTGGPTKAKKSGTVKATVKVFGPAPLQAAWGATVEVRAPGYFKSLKTGENGTVSASVKSTGKGKLTVTVPKLENMIGCSAPAKNIAKAAKAKAKKSTKAVKAKK